MRERERGGGGGFLLRHEIRDSTNNQCCQLSGCAHCKLKVVVRYLLVLYYYVSIKCLSKKDSHTPIQCLSCVIEASSLRNVDN